jgi:hypothetical protein
MHFSLTCFGGHFLNGSHENLLRYWDHRIERLFIRFRRYLRIQRSERYGKFIGDTQASDPECLICKYIWIEHYGAEMAHLIWIRRAGCGPKVAGKCLRLYFHGRNAWSLHVRKPDMWPNECSVFCVSRRFVRTVYFEGKPNGADRASVTWFDHHGGYVSCIRRPNDTRTQIECNRCVIDGDRVPAINKVQECGDREYCQHASLPFDKNKHWVHQLPRRVNPRHVIGVTLYTRRTRAGPPV